MSDYLDISKNVLSILYATRMDLAWHFSILLYLKLNFDSTL